LHASSPWSSGGGFPSHATVTGSNRCASVSRAAKSAGASAAEAIGDPSARSTATSASDDARRSAPRMSR
jgi:hypothetical protein